MQTHFLNCTDTFDTFTHLKTKKRNQRTRDKPYIPSFFRKLFNEARFTNRAGIVLKRQSNMKT